MTDLNIVREVNRWAGQGVTIGDAYTAAADVLGIAKAECVEAWLAWGYHIGPRRPFVRIEVLK